ncbi:hypothetical protein GYB22_13350 [bacterium]|nr:hypothetical protein [bacterium]
MKKILLLLSLFFCISPVTYGTHVMGADITYTSDSAYLFKFRVTFYRDCRGVPFSNPSSLTQLRCLNSGATESVSLSLLNISEITPVCQFVSGGCSPQNSIGTGEGVEKHVYEVEIDFTKSPYNSLVNCSDEIILETGQCCRNSAITTGAATTNFYTYASIDLSKVNTNNSPQLRNDPIVLLNCYQTYYGNMGGFDYEDFDSISFSMASPLSAYGTNISYSYGYSYLKPFTPYTISSNPNWVNPNAAPPIGFYFNSKTGEMIFVPVNCSEVTVAVVEATEWRKDTSGTYQKIGLVRREMEFIVGNRGDNNSPEIQGQATVEVDVTPCAGEVCYEFTANDDVFVPPPPKARPRGDRLSFIEPVLPEGFSFEELHPNDSHPTARICVDPNVVKSLTDQVIITLQVEDNHCPLSTVSSKSIIFDFVVPDSFAKVKGFILNDTNSNCTYDNLEDSLLVERAIAINEGKNVYQKTEKDGSFEFCLEKGNTTFKLKPSPWFNDHCDSQSVYLEYDSLYSLVLFSELKHGAAGYIYTTKDSSCGISAGMRPSAGQVMRATPGEYYAITDKNGFYLLELPNGTYNVFPEIDTNRSDNFCSDTISITVNSNSVNLDTFFIQPKPVKDLGIKLSTNLGSRLRRGGSNNIVISVANLGNVDVDTLSAFLSIPADIELDLNSDYTSDGWTDYGNGVLKVFIEDLSSGNKVIKKLRANYPASSFTNGDKLSMMSYLNPDWTAMDHYPKSDTSDFTITIVAAYDPNQKNCSKDSIFTVTDRELVYTVHFQNTGDTFARDVIVTDELAEALDISSLNVFAASHDYSYSLVGRTLWVNFENINLPDSSEDYDASQGFFTFSINLKPEIFKDSIIENSASIFFDFEDPIITNTQINHFKTPIEPEYPEDLYWCLNEEVKVPFKLNFSPTASTMVYLEISDENGSFENPTRIDSVPAAKAVDTLSFVFMNQFDFDGTQYRARLVSEYPSTEVFESYISDDITFIKNLNESLELTDSVCFGQEIRAIGDPRAEWTYVYQNDQLTDSVNDASINLEEYHHEDEVFLIQTTGECSFVTESKVLEAFAQPSVELNVDSIFCYLGESVDLSKLTAISEGSGEINSIKWRYGDGDSLNLTSSASDPSHTYSSGYFDLQIKVNTDKNCSDMDDQMLRFISPPKAEIAPYSDSVCNTNEGLIFVNQSVDGDELIDHILWNTENTIYTDLDSIKHTFSGVGTFDISLKVSDAFGCNDSVMNQVTITSFPNTEITINDDGQCINDHSFELSATENTSYSKLTWDVNGTKFYTQELVLQFNSSGTFNYSLDIENSIGCINTYTGALDVYPVEQASFSLNQDYCTDETAVLHYEPSITGTTYEWYEDDVLLGSGDLSLGLDMPRTSILSLKTITEYQCRDSFSLPLIVNQKPTALISTEDVCLGDSVIIENQSLDFDAIETQFAIDFGDGTNGYNGSYIDEIQHVYNNPGTYQIELLVTTPYCRDSISANVNVFQMPTLLFEDTTGSNGFSRLFSNSSTNASNYFWYFNEQNSWILNNQPSFEFEFDEKGEYPVSLVGVTNENCSDTISRMVSVTGEVKFRVPRVFSPNGDGVDDVYSIEPSSDIETIQFELYNAQGQKVSSSTDPKRLIADPIAAGIYVVRVAITDIYGDSYSYYETILVVK